MKNTEEMNIKIIINHGEVKEEKQKKNKLKTILGMGRCEIFFVISVAIGTLGSFSNSLVLETISVVISGIFLIKGVLSYFLRKE
ncbi:MAG: hypothetical protein ACRDAU_16545 [Clostridium sp.]